MLKRFFLTAAVLTCPALVTAQESRPAPRPEDVLAREQKEKGRPEEAKARRDEGKEVRQPGVRCARYRRRGKS